MGENHERGRRRTTIVPVKLGGCWFWRRGAAPSVAASRRWSRPCSSHSLHMARYPRAFAFPGFEDKHPVDWRFGRLRKYLPKPAETRPPPARHSLQAPPVPAYQESRHGPQLASRQPARQLFSWGSPGELSSQGWLSSWNNIDCCDSTYWSLPGCDGSMSFARLPSAR